jgi:hypothetical protein
MTALLRRARAHRAPRMLRAGQLTIYLATRIAEIQGTVSSSGQGVRASADARPRADADVDKSQL